MQRTLTAQLAYQSGTEVISFQHFDCLLFERGEVLKMFLPRSKRVMLGTPQDRMVTGNLVLIFEHDFDRLRPPSQKFKFANLIAGVPIANFPSLVPLSMILCGTVDEEFFRQIRSLLDALPNSKIGWIDQFGEKFFTLSAVDRCVKLVTYLRGRT